MAVAASLDAVRQATSTIPVVFPGYGDPVGQGYGKSLARPGGNFTGVTFQGLELIGKHIELLKELIPTSAPVAVLWPSAVLDNLGGSASRRPRARIETPVIPDWTC